MNAVEFGSAGAAETSVFHQLSEGKSGSGPGTAAFAAGTAAGHWATTADGSAAAPKDSKTAGTSRADRFIETPFLLRRRECSRKPTVSRESVSPPLENLCVGVATDRALGIMLLS